MFMRLAAMLAVAGTCAGANAQNLLTNASFESPGGFLVAPWANFGNVFLDIGGVEVAAQDGMNSLKMFGASSGIQSDNVLQQTVMGITAGQEYTLSGFAWENSADLIGSENVILLQLVFQDSGGNGLGAPEVELFDPDDDVNFPSDQWIFGEVTATAPAGSTQATVILLHIQLGSAQGFPVQTGGASFWDNIVLTEGDNVLPCSPADLEAPFGVLDFFDVLGYLGDFDAGCGNGTIAGQIGSYAQDFEGLDQMSETALEEDGWLVGANVFAPDGTTFLYNYFAFPAPNGGPAFSAIDVMQGGPDQGDQQLSIYNDYNNVDHAVGNRIEANVFQERMVGEADVGETITFSFDAKLGNIEGASTAQAFIKILDQNAGFSQTGGDSVDLTNTPVDWTGYTLSVTIQPSQVGQIFQFGFLTVASNFEGSGIFYDNLELSGAATGPCSTADLAAPFGTLDFFDVLEYLGQFDEGCE